MSEAGWLQPFTHLQQGAMQPRTYCSRWDAEHPTNLGGIQTSVKAEDNYDTQVSRESVYGGAQIKRSSMIARSRIGLEHGQNVKVLRIGIFRQ